MVPESLLNEAELQRVHRWRRRVVRLWLATMAIALGTWVVAAAFSPPTALEIALAVVLASLALLACREMRRGACPRCGERIRFEPRIELPGACPHCHTPFSLPREPVAR